MNDAEVRMLEEVRRAREEAEHWRREAERYREEARRAVDRSRYGGPVSGPQASPYRVPAKFNSDFFRQEYTADWGIDPYTPPKKSTPEPKKIKTVAGFERMLKHGRNMRTR